MTDKKRVAAIAAVVHYMKTQEEAAALLQSRPASDRISSEEISAVLRQMVNPWGVFGRQEQMQMRGMMQMKAFHQSIRNN